MTTGAKLNGHDIDSICKMGIRVARETIVFINTELATDPNAALERNWIGERKKKCLVIDVAAERQCHKALVIADNKKYKKWEFHGEECLRKKKLNLSKRQVVCVLADAVDGSDLVERGLFNWCSGFCFFDPREEPGRKLLASFVALPSGEVFHARRDKNRAFHTAKNGHTSPVKGPSKVKRLGDASICFYGQQVSNLKATITDSFFERLKKVIVKGGCSLKDSDLRIYNLAGIPMMMKLIDHRAKVARTIDAVFDCAGQRAHDVVPGAFIAKQAGAILKDLERKEISVERLENLLLRPAASRLKYVLASTHQLADAVLDCLGAPAKP